MLLRKTCVVALCWSLFRLNVWKQDFQNFRLHEQSHFRTLFGFDEKIFDFCADVNLYCEDDE